jgi:hypothetical protein
MPELAEEQTCPLSTELLGKGIYAPLTHSILQHDKRIKRSSGWEVSYRVDLVRCRQCGNSQRYLNPAPT